MSSDVAIIGFGFGGLMVLANLVRHAQAPCSVTVFAEDTRGTGLAYGTTNTLHLLNVPARNMSAFPQESGHFLSWLATKEAEAARQSLGLKTLPGADDFSPRALYAHYLASIRRTALDEAQQKNIAVQFIPAAVEQLVPADGGWQITAGAQQLSAQRVVIATGHEVKPVFAALAHEAIIENPWSLMAEDALAFGHRPVVMIGTGLTSVDMVLSLRRMGYHGVVHMISRNGLLPLPHKPVTMPYVLDADALLAQPNLLAVLRYVRGAIRTHARAGGDWRAVIDALRPYATTLWQKLNARDQRSFIRRLATVWNIHRHRMAPDIAAILQQEIATGKVKLAASQHFNPSIEDGKLKLAVQWREHGQEILHPAAIMNCTGPELNWARSKRPLLQQLLQQNHVVAHATRMGVVADNQYRIGTQLYAIGNPMIGQFWESTAVPELRVQATTLAEVLCP